MFQVKPHSFPPKLAIRHATQTTVKKTVVLTRLFALLVLCLAALAIALWIPSLISGLPDRSPVDETGNLPAVIHMETPSDAAENKNEPTPTVDVIYTATNGISTAKPRIFWGAGLETPIGRDRQYVVHQVKVNESLSFLAATYHTDLEKIKQVNVIPDGVGVWVGDVLVIPYHELGDEGLPPLRAVFVDGFHTLADFASEHGMSKSELISLNGMPDDTDVIASNQWLLLPNDLTEVFHAVLTPTPIFGGEYFSTSMGPSGEYVLHQVTLEKKLSEIAVRYGTTSEVLAGINGLDHAMTLVTGQVIVVRPNFRLVSLADRIYLFHIGPSVLVEDVLKLMEWDDAVFYAYNPERLAQPSESQTEQWVIYPEM